MNGGMYTTEPVVADGMVYMAVTTALTPSSSEGYVAAYDPDADETVWERDDISRPGTPTVGDGTVYFGTRGSEDASGSGFFALDSGTGETKWHKEESDWIDNPLVADGGLYADVSGGIARFDPDTGDVVWKTEAASGVTCFGDGALFCGNGIALNADDGSVRWDVSGDGDVLQTVADGRVFSTENRSGEYAIKARSVEDGRELWTHTLAMSGYWFGNRLTVANGCVFYRINDAVQALEVENGYDAWTYEADASLAGAVSVGGDTLYAGGRADPESETGNAVVLALNTTTGELNWRHEFGKWDSEDYGPAANSPVVVDGKVYTATYPLGSTTDWMYTRYGDFHVLGSADDPTTTTTEERRRPLKRPRPAKRPRAPKPRPARKRPPARQRRPARPRRPPQNRPRPLDKRLRQPRRRTPRRLRRRRELRLRSPKRRPRRRRRRRARRKRRGRAETEISPARRPGRRPPRTDNPDSDSSPRSAGSPGSARTSGPK